MRTLLFIGLAIGGAFAAGWFRVHREGDHTMIHINRGEIRSDARRAIDRGRDFLDQRDAELAARDSVANSRDADNVFDDRRYETDRYEDDYYLEDRPLSEQRYARPDASQRF